MRSSMNYLQIHRLYIVDTVSRLFLLYCIYLFSSFPAERGEVNMGMCCENEKRDGPLITLSVIIQLR